MGRLSERRMSEAAAEIKAARAGVDVLSPLTLTPLPSGLPAGAPVRTLGSLAVDLADDSSEPWMVELRGRERKGCASSVNLRLSNLGDGDELKKLPSPLRSFAAQPAPALGGGRSDGGAYTPR